MTKNLAFGQLRTENRTAQSYKLLVGTGAETANETGNLFFTGTCLSLDEHKKL